MGLEIENKANKLIVDFKNVLPRMDYHQLEISARECSILCAESIIDELNGIEMMESGKVFNGFDQDFYRKVIKHLKSGIRP